MAEVVVVYGPQGSGKTAVTLRLAELLEARGLRVGGFFQRATGDELERRGYDLVRFRNRAEAIALACPGARRDEAVQSTGCSFVFSRDALDTGLTWLRADAAWANVLVIDEVSKLEVAGGGHYESIRWALALPSDILLLLSVRADQLVYAVEKFDLVDHIRGDVELPATAAQLDALAHRLTAAD